MVYTLNNQNIASWRPINQDRPWYKKAISILPKTDKFSTLDLGSGSGEFSQMIKPLVNKITCVDFSLQYVNQLKKKGFKAIQADLNHKLPFKSKEFDLVISLEVIEHLFNAEYFISEINRVLKPKGYLLISTPNIAWWGYRLEVLLGRPPKKEGYHFRFFTHKKLSQRLNQAGFKIVRSASFTTVPILNRFLLKLNFKPIYLLVNFWPNLLAQDLVFLCQKK